VDRDDVKVIGAGMRFALEFIRRNAKTTNLNHR
jgi:hypothetical protein